jgi:ferrous iron transport protein A
MSPHPPALDSIAAGKSARITALGGDPRFAKRLHAMGFRAGQIVRVVRRAPFAGPMQVRLGATDVMLRTREAALVRVEALAS